MYAIIQSLLSLKMYEACMKALPRPSWLFSTNDGTDWSSGVTRHDEKHVLRNPFC